MTVCDISVKNQGNLLVCVISYTLFQFCCTVKFDIVEDNFLSQRKDSYASLFEPINAISIILQCSKYGNDCYADIFQLIYHC